MLRKTKATWVLRILIITPGILVSACQSRPQPLAQEPSATKAERTAETKPSYLASPLPPSASPPQVSVANETAKLPPPKPTDIRDAVTRIFAKAATSDLDGQQSFVVGDFNGDGAEDLAVVVKPDDTSIAEINSEVANWTLEDPSRVAIPGATAHGPVANKPVLAEKGTALLAIIHGVGRSGWRSPEAKQSYLLKNGVGNHMLVQSAKGLRSTRQKRELPPLQGDAIVATISGKSGLLFWTGAKYAWYSAQAQAEATLR